MHGHLVAAPGDLGGQVGVGRGHVPEHEERRPPAQVVEGFEERRGRTRVGPVVEGQGHVAGRADAGQARRPADARPAHTGGGGEQLGHRPQGQRPGYTGGDGGGGVHCSQLKETLARCWLDSWARTLPSRVVSWGGVTTRPFRT